MSLKYERCQVMAFEAVFNDVMKFSLSGKMAHIEGYPPSQTAVCKVSRNNPLQRVRSPLSCSCTAWEMRLKRVGCVLVSKELLQTPFLSSRFTHKPVNLI